MILKQIKLTILFVFGLVFLAQAQQTIPATGGDASGSGGIGLSDENSWCSNQYSQTAAWQYHMLYNSPSPASKNSTDAVRAVR